jgi:aspartyl-tRNA(Asn)/glutamyl-tRNA(Gln) amidotransferase subunit B
VAGALPGQAKLAANWIIGELTAALNREALASRTAASMPRCWPALAAPGRRRHDLRLHGQAGVRGAVAGRGDADAIIEARGLKQITDTGELERIIDQVLAANPDQVQQYRDGKTKVIGFLVGQAMKATGGKANPAQLNELLKSRL